MTTIEGRDVELVAASHDNGILRVVPTGSALAMRDAGQWDLVHCAELSLIVAVAMDGWPLRSTEDADESWNRAIRSADGGPDPDALGYKIVLAERWAAKQGWHPLPVLVPGLDQFRERMSREEIKAIRSWDEGPLICSTVRRRPPGPPTALGS